MESNTQANPFSFSGLLKELSELSDEIEKFKDSPKLGELPSHVMDLAIAHQKRQKGIVDFDKKIVNAFKWDATPEGHEFWSKIAQRQYPPKIHTPEAATETPAAQEFKNGEKVEVRKYDEGAWLKATFIGMHENKFIVIEKDGHICKRTHCRKVKPPEEKEDKNAFVKGLNTKDLYSTSDDLFGNEDVLQILDGCTPVERPDLRCRAFYVPAGYNVETGKCELSHGTFISIHRK